MLDGNPGMTTSKDTIMIRLLDACVTILKEQGMKRVFLDAVKGGYEGFQSMGKLRRPAPINPTLDMIYHRVPEVGDI